jgi:Conserved protein/domain typically associated with flavoprotein oxygenases, DIM6/NTAB family
VRELRNAFGEFATGVCVVAATDQSGQVIGVTVNSFSSVSLEPALALWSIQNNSELFAFWCSQPRYSISILASDQESLSNQCAKPSQHSLGEHQFELGKHGTPLIVGAAAHFELGLTQVVPAGDHHIIIGEILSYQVSDGRAPLLFHKGQYRALAS